MTSNDTQTRLRSSILDGMQGMATPNGNEWNKYADSRTFAGVWALRWWGNYTLEGQRSHTFKTAITIAECGAVLLEVSVHRVCVRRVFLMGDAKNDKVPDSIFPADMPTVEMLRVPRMWGSVEDITKAVRTAVDAFVSLQNEWLISVERG